MIYANTVWDEINLLRNNFDEKHAHYKGKDSSECFGIKIILSDARGK